MRRSFNRRELIASLSAAGIGTVVGCTSSEPENNSSPSATTTSVATSSVSTTAPASTPYRWRENVPSCSSGDYIFRVRGVTNGGAPATPAVVSIENIDVESHSLSTITVIGEYSNIQTYPDVLLEGGESESVELQASGQSISSPEEIIDIRAYSGGVTGDGGCGGVGDEEDANSRVIENDNENADNPFTNAESVNSPTLEQMKDKYFVYGYSYKYGVVITDLHRPSGSKTTTGRAINESDTDYRYVELFFEFFKNGSSVGEVTTEAGNLNADGTYGLMAGEQWRFEVTSPVESPDRETFAGIRVA